MFNAQAYQKATAVAFKSQTCKILEVFGHQLKWQGDEYNILDIGCGEGTTTVEALDKFISKHAKNYHLLGVDIQESMLEIAREKYGNLERVKFKRMDIEDKSTWVPYKESFHHIFSILCMHYLTDQRAWIKNLYDMLKTAGQMFLVLPSTNPFLKSYFRLVKEKKYAKHQKANKPFNSPFLTSKEPMLWLTPLLEEAGFKNIFYKNIECALEIDQKLAALYVRSCTVMVDNFPSEIGEEFFNEVADNMAKQSLLDKEFSKCVHLVIIAEK